MADSYFVSVLGLVPGQNGPTIALALIEPDALILRIADRPDLRLKYAELSVAVDPADPERVLLRGNGLGAGSIVVDDRRIGDQIAARAPAEFSREWGWLQARGRQGRRDGSRRIIAAILLGAAMAAGAAWWGYGALMSLIVYEIPTRYESKLSELANGADETAIKDPEVVAAVDKISGRLLATLHDSPYQFHIVVIPDEKVNAFALPGGRIVVLSGLIAQTESPDELAGVLAHEMQHVLHRDALRGIVRRLGAETVFLLLFAGHGAAAEALRQVAPGLLSLRFSRSQEAEADSGGMEMLFAAGIPGDGMVRFFKELSTKETGTVRAMNFASDHPTSKGRFEDLERLRASRPAPPPVDWGLDWAAIRERCRAARAPTK